MSRGAICTTLAKCCARSTANWPRSKRDTAATKSQRHRGPISIPATRAGAESGRRLGGRLRLGGFRVFAGALQLPFGVFLGAAFTFATCGARILRASHDDLRGSLAEVFGPVPGNSTGLRYLCAGSGWLSSPSTVTIISKCRHLLTDQRHAVGTACFSTRLAKRGTAASTCF